MKCLREECKDEGLEEFNGLCEEHGLETADEAAAEGII